MEPETHLIPIRTYETWMDYHATMFGFAPEQEAHILAAWANLFARHGYTPGELYLATDRMALFGAPKWRRDHVNAICAAVRELRQRTTVTKPDDTPERGTCTSCSSSGYMIVPHPKTLTGQTPIWHTLAVLCHCALGRWIGSRSECKSLDQYEREFPNWREHLAHHEQLLKAEREAVQASERADAKHGELVGHEKKPKEIPAYDRPLFDVGSKKNPKPLEMANANDIQQLKRRAEWDEARRVKKAQFEVPEEGYY